jgi:hypothetical protein
MMPERCSRRADGGLAEVAGGADRARAAITRGASVAPLSAPAPMVPPPHRPFPPDEPPTPILPDPDEPGPGKPDPPPAPTPDA